MHDYELLEDGATLRFRGQGLPLEDAQWATDQARAVPRGCLPVVLGAGRGKLLALLAQQHPGPLAVLDAEAGLLAATGALAAAGSPMLHLTDTDPEAILKRLVRWREEHNGATLHVLPNPTYLRLNPQLYATVARALRQAGPAADKAQFRARRSPKLLLLRFGFFLEREICAALTALGVPYAVFRPGKQTPEGGANYIKTLFECIRTERPDALLSVNFLGGDMRGALFELLERLRLPFATWFVDSPELLLHGMGAEPSESLVPFTCDPDGPAKLEALGLGGAHYLPLACDAQRFDLSGSVQDADIRFPVSFVGTTWVDKLAQVHRNFRFTAPVLRTFQGVACELAERRPSGPLAHALNRHHPNFAALFTALPPETQNGVLHLLCWEGNRRYRLERVRRLLPLAPLIVGDRHWMRQLGPEGYHALLHPPLGYYGTDLTHLYASSTINFTCGGVQMPQAANQRHFDVPACGGFLLTDRSRQVEELFDPDTEIVCYDHPEDIVPLAERYTKDRPAAMRVIRAARKRIAAQHTYVHRIQTLLNVLRNR